MAAEGGDWAPGIAAGLFLAVKQGALKATAENLRYVVAIAALILPVCNIFFRRDWTNEDTATLAPLALAIESLKIASITPAAVAAFGTKLCGNLASLVNVDGAYYVVLATLAAAVYANYSAIWISAALLIVYGGQLVQNARGSKYMASPAAVGLAAAYALVRYFKDGCSNCASELAACFVMARLGWSVFSVVKHIFEKQSE